MGLRNLGRDGKDGRMPGRLHLFGVLGVLAGVAVPGAAWADGPRAAVRLDYRRAPGTESCPQEKVLRDALSNELGYDPVHPQAPEALTVTLYRGPNNEVHAHLELRDAAGTLTWERHQYAYNNACGDLVTAIAVDILLEIDPLLRPAAALPPPPPRAVPPKSPPRLAPAPQRVASPWPTWTAAVGGDLSIGSLPAITGGPVVGVAARWPAGSMGLEGRFDVPAGRNDGAGGQVDAWILGGTAAPCGRWRIVDFCGLLTLGAFRAAGSGVDVSAEGARFYAALGARLAAVLPLDGGFSFRAHADLAGPLQGARLRLRGVEVWRSPPLAATIGLGIEFSFSRVQSNPTLSRTAGGR